MSSDLHGTAGPSRKRQLIVRLKRRIRWAVGRDLYVKPEVEVPVQRFGKRGYWTLATTGLNRDTMVWSFGIGKDMSCELELIERYGLRVLAFDPTPIALEWVKRQDLPEEFKVFPFGVADYDGLARFAPPRKQGFASYSMVREGTGLHAPVRRMTTLQRELNLLSPDVVKMDVEGAEYAVVADMVRSGYRPAQVLVEFHHKWMGAKATREAIAQLGTVGYRIAFVSRRGVEYTFVRQRSAEG